jgi:DNA-directed RNA polymerase specialized sigma54-like protein
MQNALDQTIEIQQSFSPLLMQANHILSLSQTELESAINEAIEENPALELEDCVVCPVCGRRTNGEPCGTCRIAQAEPPPVSRTDEALPRHETRLPHIERCRSGIRPNVDHRQRRGPPAANSRVGGGLARLPA